MPHTVCTVCTQQCMPTDIRGSIIQNIASTSQWVSALLNSVLLYAMLQPVMYIILSLLLHKHITWHHSDSELRRSNSQRKSVNHFFSGFKTLHLQTNPMAVQRFACCTAINHILDDSDVHLALCVTLSCIFYRQHKLNLRIFCRYLFIHSIPQATNSPCIAYIV